eukprot:596125-Alexandrium_andersonii.AAC.1
MSKHAGLRGLVRQWGQQAGYHCLEEQYVPCLQDAEKGAAVLDIHCMMHPFARERCIDVTIRHPCAQHVMGAAAKASG